LKGNDVKAWRCAGSLAWSCEEHDLLPRSSGAALRCMTLVWELLGDAWQIADRDPYVGQDREFRCVSYGWHSRRMVCASARQPYGSCWTKPRSSYRYSPRH
jgi:hypothetical protein